MSQSHSSGLIAVIDVETTGLEVKRGHRIVELAAVVIDLRGHIVSEFETLINPNRDVGPSWIHGIFAKDITDAPRFEDIAGLFVRRMEGVAALAGHNIRFDLAFLKREFRRIGVPFPQCPSICTMQYTGRRRLCECCRDYGITIAGQLHSALDDARAAASLLSIFLPSDLERRDQLIQSGPILWPRLVVTGRSTLTRRQARSPVKPAPTYIQRVLEAARNGFRENKRHDAVAAYRSLLDRVLADRLISEQEPDALEQLAEMCGLDPERIDLIHREYLRNLIKAARANGVVADTERNKLLAVASLLGQPGEEVFRILQDEETH